MAGIGGAIPGSGTKKGTVRPREVLLAMRHVFEHEEADDTTPAHRHAREMLKKDPFKFSQRLTALEKHHQEVNERSRAKHLKNRDDDDDDNAVSLKDLDEPEKRVRELIAQLLQEAKEREPVRIC